MKTLKFVLFIAGLLIFMACNGTDRAISGIYTLNFKNEFTITNDTMVIEAYNLEAGTYRIQRRAGYHLIRDGKILPKEFSQETDLGRQVYINADGHSLSYQGTYQKVKLMINYSK